MKEHASGLGIIENGMIASLSGRIVYCGPEPEAPWLETDHIIDCGGRWITPGLIDCHTHLVFGGDRIDEFEKRLQGATYEELAVTGGIRSSVSATRGSTSAQLMDSALARLDGLIAEGLTSIEVKSGYGLDEETELRQLEVARELNLQRDVDVSPTYLGAHAVPIEFQERPDDYVAFVCDRMIPQIASNGLAQAVDAFCDTVALTTAQTGRVLAAARKAGLAIRLHADQLSDTGGAALAAAHGALSADHLEFASETGIAAMGRAGTVAVLLPGAFLTSPRNVLPRVSAMRRHGVRIAVGTDLNPGSSPLASPLLAMALAANLFGLTVEECLRGMTTNAAYAMGRALETGTLEAGKSCDLAIWSIERPAELVYWLGRNPLHRRVWHGR